MAATLDMSGMKVGRLTVLQRGKNTRSPSRSQVVWDCVCDCGKLVTVRRASLRAGITASCGCLKTEELKSRRTKRHGHEPEYRIWTGIKQRCLNKKSAAYDRYGGRGITICDSWKASFGAFLDDMGARPSLLHSIDRINNDGGYSQQNCRWALEEVQSRNKCVNRWVEIEGVVMVITDWIKRLGISQSTVYKNLKTMPDKQALINSRRKRNVS